jgi:hypothetical protein
VIVRKDDQTVDRMLHQYSDHLHDVGADLAAITDPFSTPL